MKFFCLLPACLLITASLVAQPFYFPKISAADTTSLQQSMPVLAQHVLEQYKQDKDQRIWLINVSMIQIVSKQYAEAAGNINKLRKTYNEGETRYPELLFLQFELFSKARLKEASGRLPFAEAFSQYFMETFSKLDDKAALFISTAFSTRNGIDELRQDLQNLLVANKRDSLDMRSAINLLRAYNLYTVFKTIEPLSILLLAQEDTKRYIIDDSILIKTKDGVQIAVMVARKRGITIPQPAILQFTIYARHGDTYRIRDAANNGYVGVIAYSRGKYLGPDEIFPYEHDGKDAYEVIDWISHQHWNNGKVGMFGGSYNGYTTWASTKKLHPALKTIVPSASVAPGLDVPMTNNVIMSFVFSWIYYVSNNKFLDDQDYNSAKWDSVNQQWYTLGLPYQSLDSLTGRGNNRIFQRWLQHPGYDKYWQRMIPYREEFSRINIPVLSTTGYYDGGQIGAMYYFREHYKYNKNARHYLLIGPWGHFGSQSFPDPVYNGYRIDSVANISIHDIIYQWFDYILKDSAKPAILKDRVNFEIMDSNAWMHVPSLPKMSNDTLRFYLSNKPYGAYYSLKEKKPVKAAYLAQTIDFKDRTTRNNYYRAYNIIYDSLDVGNGLAFISDPIKEAMSINGAFLGEIKAALNKKDMDFSVTLYELKPDGKYFYLSYFMGRASYAKDIMKRQLLKPGQVETIPFSNTYITAKKITPGSCIVIVLNINKSPNEQINYGTGKDVSAESMKDAVEPLQVKWFSSSVIKIPVWKN